MYQCNNCGAVFEDPKAVYESHGLDYPPFEKIYVCPACEVDNMEEVDEDEEGTV